MNTIATLQSSFNTLRQTLLSSAEQVKASPDLQKTVGALAESLNDFAAQLQGVLQAPGAAAGGAAPVSTGAVAAGAASNPSDVGAASVSDVVRQLVTQASLAGSAVTQATAQGSVAATRGVGGVTGSAAAAVIPAADRVLEPGERGAGLPANYLKSERYQAWLAQQPQMTGSVAEYGKALQSWQEANPYYVNPKNYGSFDEYLTAVTESTASGNVAGQSDPSRYQSFLRSYYGTAADVNPWANSATPPTEAQVAQWPEEVQALYRKTVEATKSMAALEQSGLIAGNMGRANLRGMGLG